MAEDPKIQQFVLLAKGARGRALAELVTKATSEPGLFGFSELLAMPSVQELASGDQAPYLTLLQLFAYGTWSELKATPSLPELNEQQRCKLKQLSVVSLALKQKSIPYSTLQQELEIDTVRSLEDFIITECFYSGIIKGKLDQKQACLEIHDVIGRDVRPEQLGDLEDALKNWMGNAESLLGSIEERINFAIGAAEQARKAKQESEAKAEEMKKNVKAELDLRSADMLLDEAGTYEGMDEDRMDRMGMMPPMPGMGERQDRADRAAAGRPKRRLR